MPPPVRLCLQTSIPFSISEILNNLHPRSRHSCCSMNSNRYVVRTYIMNSSLHQLQLYLYQTLSYKISLITRLPEIATSQFRSFKINFSLRPEAVPDLEPGSKPGSISGIFIPNHREIYNVTCYKSIYILYFH